MVAGRLITRWLGPVPFKAVITRLELWREYANYIRPARVYFDGALTVPGTSSALLQYYSALQLAKAELLASQSGSVVGKRIAHGLIHHVGTAGNPAGDFLQVAQGVFPLLYERRTEVPIITPGTRLYVRDLLRHVPEIEIETAAALGLTPRTAPTFARLPVTPLTSGPSSSLWASLF